MSDFHYDMHDLFDQLGLDSSSEAMAAFIRQHQLDHDTPLDQASFWKPHQAAFIVEARAQDADWSEAVDDLDALLRKSN